VRQLPVSNTDGAITSTVDHHSGKGFSIVKYTGTGSGTPTVGHGMSTAPQVIWFKNITSSQNWFVFFKPSGGNTTLWEGLNNTAGALSTNYTGFTIGSSTVSFSGNDFNYSGRSYIMYCWHNVSEFSKFGTYTGNNSTDGPIVNLGFEPAFLMIKRSDSSSDWGLWDNKKTTTNPRNIKQNFNDNSAQSSANTALNIDFLTNGFRIRNTNVNTNASGGTYFYMAFAADPNTTSPALADSFNAVNYTGNGSSQSITGVGFSPSLTWIKQRDAVRGQNWYDAVRGPNALLLSNGNGAEDNTSTELLQSFDSNGFSLGNLSAVNASSGSYISWNWKANSLPGINTNGSLDTVVSANANAGFSIVQVTGAGANTFGHGLSSAPELIIFKGLNVTQDWYVYHKDLNEGSNPAHYFIKLNSSDAETLNGSSGGSIWNSTAPTSTVFSLGTSLGNGIAYCFHSVSGFSDIGSYSGNSTSGRLINIGFQPDWVMIKTTNATSNWFIIDSVRGGLNDLRPNASNAEETRTNGLTFVSNGFEIDDTTVGFNNTGTNYIYAAFKIN
jgi:hypothetical protein